MAAVIGVLVLHLCLCSARAGVVLVSVMPQVRWWGMFGVAISGRGSRGTITAADGGQENARIQATAGNPVTGSEWIAACYLHG